jgi:phosphoribosylaminoimidazole (AIR) synthetase
MGIGMTLICAAADLETVKAAIPESYLIGKVTSGEKKVRLV